jgi:hypothetical protein
LDVISELQGVSVPVKVVLEVFNAETKTYTDSAVDAQCYKAGNSCPEAHVVCKPEYCEMDVWKTIIADFKAASPGKVSVLGSVGVGTTSSEYFGLAVDGIYFVGTDTVSTVAKEGEYLFEHTPHAPAGPHGPGSGSTAFTTQAACVQTALDNGMTFPFQLQQYSDGKCYFYEMYYSGGPSAGNAGYDFWTVTEDSVSVGTTVSAIGAPLFDADAVDDADVYVTLASSDLGIWNPFSWFPYVPPSKWAAIVTEATDTSAVATLFDRGYGWVYLTSEAGLETKSAAQSCLDR